MSCATLVIQTEGKGRSFSALALCRVYAPAAWPEGGITERDRHRPALMLLGCANEEAAAFRANLAEGRKLRLFGGDITSSKGEPCEIQKSARFAVSPQKTDAGTLLLVRHPEVFQFAPGMIDGDVRFVCLPDRKRLVQEASRFDLAATNAHLGRCGFLPWTEENDIAKDRGRLKADTRLAMGIDDPLFPAFAALLVAGISNRVGYPIPSDPLFWAQFAAALLAEGLAVRSPERCYDPEVRPYAEVGVSECGFYPGAAVVASHEGIGEVLARETAAFLNK